MGNAVVIINHPTSLDHGVPALHRGKVAAEYPGMIRLERDLERTKGCGATVTFKRIVKEYNSSHTIASENDTTLQGATIPWFGWKNQRKGKTHIEHIVTDRNDMSELECHANYNGKNKGRYKWLSNDLRLKAEHRWSRNSELFIKITFREEGDSGGDTVVETEYKEMLDEGEGYKEEEK